ncbi:conserved protein, unknown function [Hepatocystis sp. ex Piliocolobus tephrosceles]|nr:conserved protein, unknown function [Hepatocystis sp. ex Piliocolobus tephrosceles]
MMNVIYSFCIYSISCLVGVALCSDLCNYGEYFMNNTCYECGINSYSNSKNAESCFQCPPSSFNKKTSSKYIYDCSCSNGYFLNHIGNRCDMCHNLSSNFYCENDLNELEVTNFDLFFLKIKEIALFHDYDKCVVKGDKKNIYPFMNNLFIYCKRPDICIDTCGKCFKNNEGFLCDQCKKNYYKNIYLKYSFCSECYNITLIILVIIIYVLICVFFLLLLLKFINISLYFYNFNIYKKGTIYFLHYLREFMFYLSLILLISFSNDLTETEREHYSLHKTKQAKNLTQLHSGDLELNYYLNIYLHNKFFDIIKLVYLNFLSIINLHCFFSKTNNFFIHKIQTLVFFFFVIFFLCFTFICNLIYLKLKKKWMDSVLWQKNNNAFELKSRIKNSSKNTSKQGKNNKNSVGIIDRSNNKSNNKDNNNRNKNNYDSNFRVNIQNKGIIYILKFFLFYPLLLTNYTFPTYINITFFNENEVIHFLKSTIQIYYYQYMNIILYIANSLVMFIFLSPYICIGLFNYNISYYEASTLCYDFLHFSVTKVMGIIIILFVCFFFYIILLFCIITIPKDLRQNYNYKCMYGFYTFLCEPNKYYYYILKIFLINILFLFIIQSSNHLSFLIYMTFFFLLFICIFICIKPYTNKCDNYNVKSESVFFMFIFFFNIQLEILRILTYNITLRITFSFVTIFIYVFILFYYLFFMLRDMYMYGSVYIKYVNMKTGLFRKNKKQKISQLENDDGFFIYYYLKNRMKIDLFKMDEDKNKLSTDNKIEYVEEHYGTEKIQIQDIAVATKKSNLLISQKNIDYIYYQCVLISPFIAETIIQLLFIMKNIKHIIRLKTNLSNSKIYNFLFTNGYIEVQKTPIDRFITKVINIYKKNYKDNYDLFKTEMTSMFTNMVNNLKCFKDVWMRECIAKRIKNKYKIVESDEDKIIYDENYEEKHVNTFLYKLRKLSKGVKKKKKKYSLHWSHVSFRHKQADKVVLKKNYSQKKNKKKKKIHNLNQE